MIDVALAAVPNQSLSVQLDARGYVITLHQAGACVAATVVRDDVTIVDGVRVTPGTPLLPYRYQEAGNFILIVQDEALPDYTQFGVTQFLTYLSADELAGLRDGSA